MAKELLLDDIWGKLKGLLPPERERNCRPSRDLRTILEEMLWNLRTGAPCMDVPEEFGSWSTISKQFP